MVREVPHTTPTSPPIMPETGGGGKELYCAILIVSRSWKIGVILLVLNARSRANAGRNRFLLLDSRIVDETENALTYSGVMWQCI